MAVYFAHFSTLIIAITPVYYLGALLYFGKTVLSLPSRVQCILAIPVIIMACFGLLHLPLAALILVVLGFLAACVFYREELRKHPQIYKGILVPTGVLFVLILVSFLIILFTWQSFGD